MGMIVPAATAQQTKILTADKHNEYGLVYTLPTTALDIEVTAERTVQKAGKYWQYAKRYIGTDKVVREDSESWKVVSVKVTPYGVPNTETQYLMQLKPGALTSISVAEDNMLLAINKEVAAPVKPGATEVSASVVEGSRVDMNEYLQYVDGDFISSQSSAKQAQMLAQSLMDVRDAKVSLSRGTAESMPTDGRQLELMLESLSKQEQAFTVPFTGTVEKETVTRRFTYIPDKEGESVLFRMSDFAGFVDADDYSGDPVKISVKVVERGELPVNEKGEVKKLPKDAVAYIIPGRATVKLTLNGKELWSHTGEYSQYGVEFGLAPGLFSDKKARSWAEFDPSTGAVRNIGEIVDAQ